MRMVTTMGGAMAIDDPQMDARLRLKVYPVPQSPGIARTFVRHHLISLGHADLVEDGCTIASELVTNAIRETPEREVLLYLSLKDDGCPVLEVWDSSPVPPVLRPEDPFAINGRGLRIVTALAAECGYRILTNGKIIWARLK
jgi:anti-sigma regulatory factor (Ser/Thr protein kinase)